mgnify:CR=1 FL=1
MNYSVLMTIYKNDNPEYFKLALESMVKQTLKPDEIVLVKDGPITIKLQNVIDDFKKIYNKIVEVNLEENVGLGLALNYGLKVCKNEIIARMDSDDISELTRCEKQISYFIKNKKYDIVGCPVKEFIDNKENVVSKRDVPLTNEEIYNFAKKRDPFNHPTVMYRKSRVLKVGGYGNYRKNQDTDLWIKMLNDGCYCANVNEYLLNFRFDENTYKKRKSWVNTKLLIKIRWNAYKIGFSSIFDFLKVLFIQLSIYVMPTSFQKIVYKKILRR